MKITRVNCYPVTLAVRPEYYIVSAAGAHAVSRYVFVNIETDGGLTGWGEATVVPLWSGESQGGAMALINDYFAPMLDDEDPADYVSLIARMDGTVSYTHLTLPTIYSV